MTAIAPRVLDLAPGLAVPLDVATQPIGIFGKRGSGKSNAAVVLAEQLWLAGVPWVALDPVDHWWGLKARADGTQGFAVYVFGGRHADLPLEATAGALMAEVVSESARPIVLCTAEFLEGERSRFVTDFALALRRRMAERPHPLHVFLEEADEFIPQTPAKDELRMVSAVTKLVLRSRQDGIGATLITQRPARVKKDVTTQIEVLCAFRTLGPQDRDAIDDWIRYHEQGALRGEVLGGLATLQPGESFVWSPQWLEFFGRVQWPRRQTFDAAATPKVGERIITPHLADVDLEALRERMAATIERAQADDPALLRKEIASLRAQLAERAPERVEVPVLSDETRAELHSELTTIRETIGSEVDALQTLTRDILVLLAGSAPATFGIGVGAASAAMVVRDGVARLVAPDDREARLRAQQQVKRAAPPPTPAVLPPVVYARGSGAARVLDALAWWAALRVPAPTKQQVGIIAGYRADTGHFGKILAALVASGSITYPKPGTIALTDAGAKTATPTPLATTSAALQERVLARLTGPQRTVLSCLIHSYGHSLSRRELGERAGYRADTGHFGKILAHLHGAGLITYPASGQVCAASVLFLGKH